MCDEFCGCFRNVEEGRQLYGSEVVFLVVLFILIDIEQEMWVSLSFALGHSVAIDVPDNAFQIVHEVNKLIIYPNNISTLVQSNHPPFHHLY